MKRLLLGIIISGISALVIPVTIIGLTNSINEPLTASHAQFFTRENTPVNGELNHLITIGKPPYIFEIKRAINGTVKANQSGSFLFTLNPGAKYGSFDYVVTDASGDIDNGTAVIIVE